MQIFGGGKEFADREDLDKLSGKSHISVDDANKMTESGFHYISNHDGRPNYPVQSWGNMIISNGENQKIVQIFTPDNGQSPWFRTFDGSAWHDWNQFATMSGIQRLEQEISDLKKQIGGLTIRQGKDNEDLNTIFDPQIVSWTGSAIKNSPNDVQYKNYGTLINLPDGMTHNESDGVQLFADPDSTLWLRAYFNSGSDWTPWKKISTTDDLKK